MLLLRSGRNTWHPPIPFNTATACTKESDSAKISPANGPRPEETTQVRIHDPPRRGSVALRSYQVGVGVQSTTPTFLG